MSNKIYILLLLGSILFLFGVIFMIRKSKMIAEMGCVWIIVALGILILAIFPQIAIQFGRFLGIISTVNVMFLVMIFLLLCLVFYLFIKVSYLQNRINSLIQLIALKEKEK